MFGPLKTNIVKEIHTFCNEHGMSISDFGLRFAHDNRFVPRLEAGMNVGIQRLDGISQRVASYLRGEADTSTGVKSTYRPDLYADRDAA